MKSGKVLLGVLAGVAAGALIGVLFAPDKGANTRKKILSKGDDYADALKEKFDELLGTVTNKSDSIHDDAEELASKGKRRYDEVKKEVKNATF